VLGRFAIGALDAHHVPLGAAQRTMQVAVAARLAADTRHARDRARRTHRADAGHVDAAEALVSERGGHVHPINLQRAADERRVSTLETERDTSEQLARLRFVQLTALAFEPDDDFTRAALRRLGQTPQHAPQQIVPAWIALVRQAIERRHAVALALL